MAGERYPGFVLGGINKEPTNQQVVDYLHQFIGEDESLYWKGGPQIKFIAFSHRKWRILVHGVLLELEEIRRRISNNRLGGDVVTVLDVDFGCPRDSKGLMSWPDRLLHSHLKEGNLYIPPIPIFNEDFVDKIGDLSRHTNKILLHDSKWNINESYLTTWYPPIKYSPTKGRGNWSESSKQIREGKAPNKVSFDCLEIEYGSPLEALQALCGLNRNPKFSPCESSFVIEQTGFHCKLENLRLGARNVDLDIEGILARPENQGYIPWSLLNDSIIKNNLLEVLTATCTNCENPFTLLGIGKDLTWIAAVCKCNVETSPYPWHGEKFFRLGLSKTGHRNTRKFGLGDEPKDNTLIVLLRPVSPLYESVNHWRNSPWACFCAEYHENVLVVNSGQGICTIQKTKFVEKVEIGSKKRSHYMVKATVPRTSYWCEEGLLKMRQCTIVPVVEREWGVDGPVSYVMAKSNSWIKGVIHSIESKGNTSEVTLVAKLSNRHRLPGKGAKVRIVPKPPKTQKIAIQTALRRWKFSMMQRVAPVTVHRGIIHSCSYVCSTPWSEEWEYSNVFLARVVIPFNPNSFDLFECLNTHLENSMIGCSITVQAETRKLLDHEGGRVVEVSQEGNFVCLGVVLVLMPGIEIVTETDCELTLWILSSVATQKKFFKSINFEDARGDDDDEDEEDEVDAFLFGGASVNVPEEDEVVPNESKDVPNALSNVVAVADGNCNVAEEQNHAIVDESGDPEDEVVGLPPEANDAPLQNRAFSFYGEFGFRFSSPDSLEDVLATWRGEPECQMSALDFLLIPQPGVLHSTRLNTEDIILKDSNSQFSTNLSSYCNESQFHAIQTMMKNRISVTMGPPGTGKTTTVALGASYLASNEYGFIVACTPTNYASDVLYRKLLSVNDTHKLNLKIKRMLALSREHIHLKANPKEDNQYLNLLHVEMRKHPKWRFNTEVQDVLKKEKKEGSAMLLEKENYTLRRNRSYVTKEILVQVDIVVCTVSTAGDSRLDYVLGELMQTGRPLSALILDEASVMDEAALLPLLCFGPRRVWFNGDPCQLPPSLTNQSAKQACFDVSRMELLPLCPYVRENDAFTLLNIQYRMAPPIANVVSGFMYDDRVSSDQSVLNRKNQHLLPMYDYFPELKKNGHLCFYTYAKRDTDIEEGGPHHSKANRAEVDITMNTLRKLQRSGAKMDTVCVLSMYESQLNLLRTALKNLGKGFEDVQLATCDSFQGKESSIVILNMVRSNNAKNIGFLTESRRLNVAISRSLDLLFIVGDISTLRGSNTTDMTKWFDLMERENVPVVEYENSDIPLTSTMYSIAEYLKVKRLGSGKRYFHVRR